VGEQVESGVPVQFVVEAFAQGLGSNAGLGAPPAVGAGIDPVGDHEVADGEDPQAAAGDEACAEPPGPGPEVSGHDDGRRDADEHGGQVEYE